MITYRQPSIFADFLSMNLLIRIVKKIQNVNFPVKNGLLFVNSRFTVQNDGNYLPGINRGNLYSI